MSTTETDIFDSLKYVSRGGQKLAKALDCFNVSPKDKVCMDCGASTGGFTDCLLQNGARFVYSIDVGYGQLAWTLRNDPRVKVMERTNIRHVTPDILLAPAREKNHPAHSDAQSPNHPAHSEAQSPKHPAHSDAQSPNQPAHSEAQSPKHPAHSEAQSPNHPARSEAQSGPQPTLEQPTLAVIDVSFISLSLVLPVVHTLLGNPREVICLIKPQFEAGKNKVGKKGVVRDSAVHEEVLNAFIKYAAGSGFRAKALTHSPVKGPKGNIEYLAYLTDEGDSISESETDADDSNKNNEADTIDIKATVELSHKLLSD